MHARQLPYKLIVLVTGMPGSGKSVFSRAASDLGLSVVCMGDAVREEARRRGLKPTRENLLRLTKELRERLGPCAVAKLTIKMLQERSGKGRVLVIDGVRSLHEVELFKRSLGRCVIVAIHTSPRERFNRLRLRGRADDPKSWEEFVERDKLELRLGIGEVIALADVMLVNEDVSEQEFYTICRQKLRELVSKVED